MVLSNPSTYENDSLRAKREKCARRQSLKPALACILNSDVTRFYLISSAPETADSEWRWEGFQGCVNSSLADTIGNLVTRVLRFAAKHFDECVPALHPDHEAELDQVLLEECGELADPALSIEEFRFRRSAHGVFGVQYGKLNTKVDDLRPQLGQIRSASRILNIGNRLIILKTKTCPTKC